MTANTAESLLREFARKRTNKSRAAEEPAKTAADMPTANAVSVRIKEAADTAEIGWCSVCSCMQTNKGRAAEELAKTAAATAQRRAAEELAETAAAAATCQVLAFDDDTAIS